RYADRALLIRIRGWGHPGVVDRAAGRVADHCALPESHETLLCGAVDLGELATENDVVLIAGDRPRGLPGRRVGAEVQIRVPVQQTRIRKTREIPPVGVRLRDGSGRIGRLRVS